MLNISRRRAGAGAPSHRTPDHLVAVGILEMHATVMRLESEIRCMKASEDAWLAATWEAWDRVRQSAGRP